jgi:hypothetical protein
MIDMDCLHDLDCGPLKLESCERYLNETSQNYKERRRGARVVMRVPVEVRGTAEDGTPIEEETHTGSVGSLGAMIRTSRLLQMGSEVVVTNGFSQQTAKFRVVWVKDRESEGLCEIGIESLKPLDDFWGVRFQPKPPAQ